MFVVWTGRCAAVVGGIVPDIAWARYHAVTVEIYVPCNAGCTGKITSAV